MFITFEGGEGCGKTTQIQLLKDHLESQGETVVTTREPGGTKLAERVREMLLDPQSVMCDEAEALLFASSRAQHVREVIRPAIERGEYVLCDRFVDSSLAYQGMGRGLGFDAVLQANEMALGGLWPHLTLWLRMDPTAALRRAQKRALFDRIEREEMDFHRRVHEGFHECWRRWPERVVQIHAADTPERVHEEVRRELMLARV